MVEAQLLANLRHPCICTFFGMTFIEGHEAMVLEYLEGGSLEAVLCRTRESALALPTVQLCRIGSEVAAGLAFLHRNGIIHRDVKAANVLLTATHHAKVSDFGISKAREQVVLPREELEGEPCSAHAEQHTLCVGTLRYAAPETLGMNHGTQPRDVPPLEVTTYDERIDVYSFGLVLWEMAHNEIAFAGKHGVAAAMSAAKGARPAISLDCPSELGDLDKLIAQCWHQEPSVRMPMSTCAETLATMCRRVAAASAMHEYEVQQTVRINE